MKHAQAEFIPEHSVQNINNCDKRVLLYVHANC